MAYNLPIKGLVFLKWMSTELNNTVKGNMCYWEPSCEYPHVYNNDEFYFNENKLQEY